MAKSTARSLWGTYIASCLSGCGNAADPTVDLSYPGSRSNQFLGIHYSAGYDQVSSALERWDKAVRAERGLGNSTRRMTTKHSRASPGLLTMFRRSWRRFECGTFRSVKRSTADRADRLARAWGARRLSRPMSRSVQPKMGVALLSSPMSVSSGEANNYWASAKRCSRF